jgi:hypothetical protein
MRRAPAEFEELLSPKGRKLLEGPPLIDDQHRFAARADALDRTRATALRDLIDVSLRDVLTEMEDPIPRWTTEGMVENYSELLPKTVRVRTAMLESRRARAFKIAEEIGLRAMLRSQSFHAFAQAVSGRKLKRGWGIQALCYGPGDYAGPHNDHHPEEADARDGYLDLHLTFATDAVAQQWLVYEKDGHFSEMTDIARVGGMTAYRLPFWHYTTPLQAKRGREADARRWVLLGTFLFG